MVIAAAQTSSESSLESIDLASSAVGGRREKDLVSSTSSSEYLAEVEIKLSQDADVHEIVSNLCTDKTASCYPLLSKALELERHR